MRTNIIVSSFAIFVNSLKNRTGERSLGSFEMTGSVLPRRRGIFP
jgi:hypothetical protein